MDNRQRLARIALLTAEVERQGVCARTGEPLTVESAVLFVRRAPWEDKATWTVINGTEWDKIRKRALDVAAAKGQTVRIIDGREFHMKEAADAAQATQAGRGARQDVRRGQLPGRRDARARVPAGGERGRAGRPAAEGRPGHSARHQRARDAAGTR